MRKGDVEFICVSTTKAFRQLIRKKKNINRDEAEENKNELYGSVYSNCAQLINIHFEAEIHFLCELFDWAICIW